MFDFRPVSGWGRPPAGHDAGEISDVAIGARDRVYLLARKPVEVIVCERDGTLVDSWGADFLGDRSHGIAVAADGMVHVVDEGRHAVLSFTAAGEPVGAIGRVGEASETGMDATSPRRDSES